MFRPNILIVILIFCIFENQSTPVNSLSNIEYLLKNFILSAKADYEYLLKRNESTDIEEDFSRKLDEFIKITTRNSGTVESNNHQRRYARDTSQKEHNSEEAGNQLIGFVDNGTVPVNFPEDICLFHIGITLYAAALHHETEPTDNQTSMTIFKMQKTGDFINIYTHRLNDAISMDCESLGNQAFIAVANNLEKSPENIKDGSPIFQINDTQIEIVQYFAAPHQNKVYLRKAGNNLYLLQTFFNQEKSNEKCPIYKWTKYHFDLLDELSCTNAMRIEPFIIDSDVFIAIANTKNIDHDIETYSYIYKMNWEHQKFELSQKLQTHAAVDVKYFRIEQMDGKSEHFLVIANSKEKLTNSSFNYETRSIVYKYVSEYFTPFQSLLLYNVTQFLPVLSSNGAFTLLVSCEHQVTKAFQYDGWTFSQSTVQLTGGALGHGVSNLRTFKYRNENTVIVVANRKMFAAETNIYLPLYSPGKNLRLQNNHEWCESTMRLVNKQNVDELARKIEKIPTKAQSDINVDKRVVFEDASIDTLYTDSLSLHDLVLDEGYAASINMAFNIIQEITNRIEKLEVKYANRTTKHQIKNQNAAQNSEKKHLQQPSVIEAPPRTFNSNQPKAYDFGLHDVQAESQIKHINELTDKTDTFVHVDTAEVLGSMKIKYLNGHPIENLVFTNKELAIDKLKVDNIILNNPGNFHRLMTESENRLKLANDRHILQAVPIANVEEIIVDDLKIDGLINQMDLATLNEFALKTNGDQIINANYNVENLYVNRMDHVESLSGKNISKIVQINGGSYGLSQNVQFASPLLVNNLRIANRLNNIKIENGKFDALMKKSKDVQIIKGHKEFENVKLLRPIVLQGKIKSASLEQINPIVSISEEIVLEGDYEITANVTVKSLLQADNIYGASGTFNFRQLHDDGLLKSTKVIKPKAKFTQPLKTKDLVSSSLNGIDCTQFVRTNTEKVQVINGEKIFMSDLKHGKGFLEAANINDIHVEDLDQGVLKKTGDQTINGKIHFKKITANKCSSLSAYLWGHKYSDFLTTLDQVISKNVTIKGTLIVNEKCKIINLDTNGKICGHDLQSIVDDSILSNRENNVFTEDKIFTGDITIDNIMCRGNIFQLGPMNAVLSHINKIAESVHLIGPLTFDKSINIKNVMFSNFFNEISSGEFGNLWLLRDGEQIFSEPQTFLTVKVDNNNFILNGHLNGFDWSAHFQNTIWLNESKQFNDVAFDRLIVQQPITLGGHFGGIKFPNDIIFKNSEFRQELPNRILFVKDLNVSHLITVDKVIGGIDYNKACDFASQYDSAHGLIIEGDAVFALEPTISTLNGYDIDKLYENSWLAHESTTLTSNIILSDMKLSGPITLNGLLNGKNLAHLSENYFSLSKPQTIVSPIGFGGNVFFQSVAKADSVHIDGRIKHHNGPRNPGIDIVHFSKNVLLRNVDQEITGQWSIYELILDENLQSTLINGLDWSKNMLRYSVSISNITKTKQFSNVNIQNLLCGNGCTVQGVDISEWIAKATFNQGNHTIQGTVLMENPVFYDDLKVFGPVNNVTFHPDNILLKNKNQTIKGNIVLANNINNKIVPLSIENVQLSSINSKSFDHFYNNLAFKDDADAKIYSKLRFNEPLHVDNLQSSADFSGINLNELTMELELNRLTSNFSDHLEQLNIVSRGLASNLKSRKRYLDSYKMIQTLNGDIKQILCLEIKMKNTTTKDVFVLYTQRETNGIINFYKWHPHRRELVLDNDLLALHPKDMDIVDITKLRVNGHDFLIIETEHKYSGVFKHTFFTFIDDKFRNVFEVYSNTSKELVPIIMKDQSCFGSYAKYKRDIVISCSYLNKRGMLGFRVVKNLGTSPVIQAKFVSSHNKHELIVLDSEGIVFVYICNEMFHCRLKQAIKTTHHIRHITTESINGKHFIAVHTQQIKNSAHFGTIEIYKSKKGKYHHLQSVATDISIKAEFSNLPTNDIILYVLTNSLTKSLIVYKYSGITNFRKMMSATTIPQGQEIFVLNAAVIDKEFVAIIVPGHSLMIIEAILK